MIGVAVNTLAVVIGSLLGLVFKKGIPEKMATSLKQALGFATLFVGISGALDGQNILVSILSLALGTIIGVLLDIDKALNNFGDFCEKKLSHGDKKSNISEGFVSASLLFCVGAMTVVGSIQAGLLGNNDMLFTKSLLDFVFAIVLTSTLGGGVMLSALVILVFQGVIALSASFVAPFLSDFVIAEMSCTGSILVMMIGTNMAGMTNIKVANYLPAVFLPAFLCPLFDLIEGGLSFLF